MKKKEKENNEAFITKLLKRIDNHFSDERGYIGIVGCDTGSCRYTDSGGDTYNAGQIEKVAGLLLEILIALKATPNHDIGPVNTAWRSLKGEAKLIELVTAPGLCTFFCFPIVGLFRQKETTYNSNFDRIQAIINKLEPGSVSQLIMYPDPVV